MNKSNNYCSLLDPTKRTLPVTEQEPGAFIPLDASKGIMKDPKKELTKLFQTVVAMCFANHDYVRNASTTEASWMYLTKFFLDHGVEVYNNNTLPTSMKLALDLKFIEWLNQLLDDPSMTYERTVKAFEYVKSYKKPDDEVFASFDSSIKAKKPTTEEVKDFTPDPKKTDSNGDTLLHVACASGATSVVRMLLAENVRTDVYNNNGETPYQLARKNGHQAVMKLFQ